MTSGDKLNRIAGFPDRRHRRRRRGPARPGQSFEMSFHFRPGFDFMEDRTLLASFLVTTTADSGAGSLRQAILDSNGAVAGANTIEFDIASTGVQAILPQSPLPAITQSVLIDGFSQPGYTGSPLIELSGGQAGGGDGLDIFCSDVTVRGLDINGFSQGAGVLISGASATGDTITANDIGTDPTGSKALANDFGVQIVNGAGDNTVGGSTASAGNLIAFNAGPGVDVEGESSVGNQITANQDFSNQANSSLEFDGSTYVSLPENLINDNDLESTIEASFETTSGGVILGYQAASPENYPASGWVPALYVGTDGRLYGDIWQFNQVVSSVAVNDGQWHSVAMVADAGSSTLSLYLDGQLVGTGTGSISNFGGYFDQIGTGYTTNWANTPGGWYGFAGKIANVRIWNEAFSASEVEQDLTTTPAANAPGLAADYPLDDGEGLTASDLTPNHDDGTLAGPDGDLPTWVVAGGEAIDLGDDGITYNATSPRQGPNNFQNYPVIVQTANGGLEGWLGGSSTPDTTFRVDVYASAGFSAQGAGQEQDYLGSLEVTTDSEGQATFDVPFSAPAGMLVVTATATDPLGNTSEVSAQRRATLEIPTQELRSTAGQPVDFSAGAGDGITIEDPDAGPLAPEWNLTLSVATGTLSFLSLSGLVGTGNGTGTLQYQGTLSALNAALAGLSYVQAAGTHGSFPLSVSADSPGAPALAAQVNIGDGTFSVTTTADSGPGSLRQAILNSDLFIGGTSTIDFAIPGQGVQTIAPLSPLPSITDPVLIDGFSQPGYAGTPLIELSGAGAGGGNGLEITCAGASVRGLDINGFASGAAILIDGASATGNWIYGNELGTDPTGSEAVRNLYGVQLLDGASDNTIGTNDGGSGGAGEGNLISGNLAAGVQVAGSQLNQIAGNLIGTDATGTLALANGTGIEITTGAYDNTVGGATAAAGNVIAFNLGPGVVVDGNNSLGNQITANRMFSNDEQGALQFDGSTDVILPENLVQRLVRR